MGTQVKVSFDYNTKPQYLVQILDGDGLDIAAGEMGIWIGSSVSTRMEAYNSVIQCMQALRGAGWIDPATDFNTARMVAGAGQAAVITVLDAALPVDFLETEVTVIQAAGFTATHDSNTGHTRRALDKWREQPEHGVALGALLFQAFADVSGSYVNDVVIGTGPVSEGRTGDVLTPSDTGFYVAQPDTAPPEYYKDGQWWTFVGDGGQNDITYSDDYLNAIWIREAGATAWVQDEIGLTGGANTAWTAVKPGTSVAGYYQYFNGDGEPCVFRAWAKKQTVLEGDGNISSITIRIDGTNPYIFAGVDFDVVTGEIGNSSIAGLNEGIYILDQGEYWEVGVQTTSPIGGELMRVSINPGSAASIGSVNSFGTGSFICANAEFRLGQTIAEVAGTPPIFTVAAPVTTPDTGVNFLIANHDNTEGIYLADTYLFHDQDNVMGTLNGGMLQVSASIAGNLMELVTVEDIGATLDSEDNSGAVSTGTFGYNIGDYIPLMGYSVPVDYHGITGALIGPPPTSGEYTDFDTPVQIDVGPPHNSGSQVPFLIRELRRYGLEES